MKTALLTLVLLGAASVAQAQAQAAQAGGPSKPANWNLLSADDQATWSRLAPMTWEQMTEQDRRDWYRILSAPNAAPEPQSSVQAKVEAAAPPVVLRPGFSVDVGFTRSDTESGLGLGLGGAFLWRRLLGIATGDFTIVPPPKGTSTNSRYYIDTFSNGQSRCRDRANGQFASDSLCSSPHALFAGMFDENFILSPTVPLTVGGGYRVGSGQGAYLAFGYFTPLNSSHAGWFVRVIAGADIVQVNLGVNIFKN